jgi:hypothetical protein
MPGRAINVACAIIVSTCHQCLHVPLMSARATIICLATTICRLPIELWENITGFLLSQHWGQQSCQRADHTPDQTNAAVMVATATATAAAV